MTTARALTLARKPAATARALLWALPAAAWADDIRDIRGPKYIFPLWLAVSLAAAAVLLLLAAYLIWRRLRRRPARALLPYEIALQRLEKTRPLMRPATVREFSIAISDIVRGYIEIRFDVTATHLTTEEFLHGLLASSSTALTSHRDLLAHFLEQCDMAKFAGVSLSTAMMQHLYDSARDFIIESAKAPPAS
jgi:hypothetical protein